MAARLVMAVAGWVVVGCRAVSQEAAMAALHPVRNQASASPGLRSPARRRYRWTGPAVGHRRSTAVEAGSGVAGLVGAEVAG